MAASMLARSAKGRHEALSLLSKFSTGGRKSFSNHFGTAFNETRYFSTQNTGYRSLWNVAPMASSLEEDERTTSSSPLLIQVRWKRKGGASAFDKPRPPTRKQRKEYYRRKRRLHHEQVGKHSAPGSKAGLRRQFAKDTWEELYNLDNPEDDVKEQERLEYDYGDAMLDDLMGNTAHYTSLATPKPRYLGHKHKQFYNTVRQEMEAHRIGMKQLEQHGAEVPQQVPDLPSDHKISLVLRAYRDRNGSKQRPNGIVKALKHLLGDLGLPTSAFGESTYTTLLTCCQTPAEARRIFLLMRQHQHPISEYSWAILADIHAKLGDFEGCDAVVKEMVTEGGVGPSLPAYTSLLAACYKVCNNGRIPHDVRARAGQLGWKRWKEMRIVGLEPDAMAYGALLRLFAARGQGERALSTLEEMQAMEVKPTTLCFSSALRAVARSQQTAIRFEKGNSRKQKRRENITLHHGKLARQIVILAEQAGVEQDDGFVAALMLCAGAAGDSATAKAILLASQVRRMDNLRTIGSDEHLKQLRGEAAAIASGSGLLSDGTRNAQALESSSRGLQLQQQSGALLTSKRKSRYPSFEEREYGKDTRKLSALLFACSQAMESGGLGDMWKGRESKGYLDDNSLRMLPLRQLPQYYDASIPGVSSTEAGMGAIDWQEEEPEHMSKRLRRAKYRGIRQDDSVGTTMDDLDEQFFKMYEKDWKIQPNDDPKFDSMYMGKEEWERFQNEKANEEKRQRLKAQSEQAPQPIEEASYRESGEEWYFDDDTRRWKTRARVVENEPSLSNVTEDEPESVTEEHAEATQKSQSNEIESSEATDEEWYFDAEARRWKTKSKNAQSDIVSIRFATEPTASDVDDENTETYFDYDSMRWKVKTRQPQPIEAEEVSEEMVSSESTLNDEQVEMYFDDSAMRWKTRPKTNKPPTASPRSKPVTGKPFTTDDDLTYRRKVDARHGHDEADSEADFQAFRYELKEQMKESGDEGIEFDEKEVREMFELSKGIGGDDDNDGGKDRVIDIDGPGMPDFESFYADIKDEWNVSEADARQMYDSIGPSNLNGDTPTLSLPTRGGPSTAESKEGSREAALATTEELKAEVERLNNNAVADWKGEQRDPRIVALQEALPGLPEKRAKKVLKLFSKSLNYPSMLELVPALRENMPEYITHGWLVRHNSRTAEFVLDQAEREKTMDIHMLNSALQVKTSSRSLDGALAYHEEGFDRFNLTPTAYSDRLVLQMLIRSHRLPRALSFKQKVEEDGRTLDIISYGSLIEYYAKHEKLGSAMLVLKECLDIHGSPPGAKSLFKLREICRRHNLEDKLRLKELIGEDPMEWLRHGQANLKREMSYKGRRDVTLARSRLVQA